jgi:WD40 repeat protein
VCRVEGLRPAGLHEWGDLGRAGPDVVQTEFFGSLHFADAGKTLVVVGTLKLHAFDARTGKSLGARDLPFTPAGAEGRPDLGQPIRDPARPIAVAADGTRYACVRGGTLTVVEVATGKDLFRHRPEWKGDPFAALSPDGTRLAVPDADRRAIELWDVGTGKKLRTLAPPATESNLPPALAQVTGLRFQEKLRFSPDGKTVFAGAPLAVYRWDVTTGEMLPPLLGHAGYAAPTPHASADGKTLVTIGTDGVFRRFDPATGKALDGAHGYAWYAKLALSPDGRWAAVGDGGGRLDLWDLAGTARHELKAGGANVVCVRFAPDGRSLAAGLADGTVRIWDVSTRRVRTDFVGGLKGSGERTEAIAYLPNGDLVVAGEAVGVRLWDLTAGRPRWTRELRGVEALAASPDGRWVAAPVRGAGEVHLLDAATGRTRHVWKGPGDRRREWAPGRPAFTPDGRWLLTAHYDGLVRVWDVDTGAAARAFGTSGEVVWEVSVSPDGRWVATSAADDGLRVWEVATGKPVLERTDRQATGSHAAFTPDGRRLLTSGSRGAMLWSLRPRPAGGDREAWWGDLAAEDPAAAYRAQWGLLDSGPGLAKFLREKGGPAVPVADEKAVRAWVADLDAPMYRRREAATRELARLGRGAEAVLREVQSKPVSDEQGKRIGQLLGRLTGDRPLDELRLARAVQVLGLSDDPEAAAVLAEWAAGAPGAPLTEAAKAGRRGR